MGLSLFISAPPAHASSFLFSFTTTQLLGALSATDATFSEDGYYAVFLQPTTLGQDNYSVQQETSPKPTGADDWQATVQTDNPFVGDGTWVEFAKLDSQTYVTLVSGANGADNGTQNIFIYGGPYTYSGSNKHPPLTFGTGTITGIMPSSAVFSFSLDIAVHPGSVVAFTGEANAIWSSGSSTRYAVPKPAYYIPFAMDFTETSPGNYEVVPEPRTWILFLAGAAGLLAAGLLKKKPTASDPF